MPSAALQPHFENVRPGRQVVLPPPPPRLVPVPFPVRAPAPPPLVEPARQPLTPKTGMTREELEGRFRKIKQESAAAELAEIKTKIRAALVSIGESKITDSVRMTRERQNRIIGILAQIAG